MRLSVIEGDPGYHKKAHRFQATLDGKIAEFVVTADEERGIILCYKRGSDGRFVKSPDKSEFLTETRFGRVELWLGRRLAGKN